VDLGAPRGDPLRATALAREFPTAAFFAVSPFRPVDAPAIGECAAHGVADILADGVDDALLGPAVVAHGFSARFAAALAEPPAALGLTSALQLGAWQRIIARAGQPVRTQELAASLEVTREHLSRAFAAGSGPTLKRVIDLVRLLAAAELAKNPGCDLQDVARILGYSSRSHLAATTRRMLGTPADSLARLRGVDVVRRVAGS
jgi:AraC-like DNA-binding protein